MVVHVAILVCYKKYLIIKTALAFGLEYEFVENFINLIEEKHGLTGYEDNLTKAKSYQELFNIYFDKKCVIKEDLGNAKLQ